MKTYILLLSFFCLGNSLFAQSSKDYTFYHKGIISAEEAIFIKNDSIRGLQLYKAVFDNYGFVFIDDCIEAFQLALYFKNDAFAMCFIKKAIENGFEIKLLKLLNNRCTCNMNSSDYKANVCIFDSFIRINGAYLDSYTKANYQNYVRRINKEVFFNLVKRHVKEQLFKNYHRELGYTEAQQDAEYRKVCDDNLRYIDSLGQKDLFPGEINTGILTDRLFDSLKLPYKSIDKYAGKEIRQWRLPLTTELPCHSELDYFEKGIVYNILFHNAKSFETISKYKDRAIKCGQMHPREYASMRYPVANNKVEGMKMCLHTHVNRIEDTKEINEKRKTFLLPSYEVDFAKHAFAHEHHLQLNFGFFNGTR